MGKALLEAARPPMWRIEGGKSPSDARFVCFGRHRIAIADIASVSLEEVHDGQRSGLIVGAGAFLFVAALLAYFVFEQDARLRFLLGTFFLGALGIAGLFEGSAVKRLSHYEMTIVLNGGGQVVFTTADRDDIQALALRIAAERGEKS